MDARGPRPRQHHRLGDLFGDVRHRDRGCRRAWHHRDQGDAGSRLFHGVLRRRHRGLGNTWADHPAVAAVRDLRHDGECLDRRAVSRWRHSRRCHDLVHDGDGSLFRPQERLGQRFAVFLAATGIRDARGRDRPELSAGDLAAHRRRSLGQSGGRARPCGAACDRLVFRFLGRDGADGAGHPDRRHDARLVYADGGRCFWDWSVTAA
jgi:hypothetical protein